jgi:hypothetical protein
MKTKMSIRRVDFEKAERSDFTDFVKAAAIVMSSRGVGEAEKKAQALRLSDRVQKAVVAGSTTGNVGITEFGTLIGSFMDSLRSAGVFDQLQRDALNVPLRPGRVVIHSSAVVASEVDEAVAKPIKSLDLTAEEWEPRKVVAMVVLSRELIDGLGDPGLRALDANCGVPWPWGPTALSSLSWAPRTVSREHLPATSRRC